MITFDDIGNTYNASRDCIISANDVFDGTKMLELQSRAPWISVPVLAGWLKQSNNEFVNQFGELISGYVSKVGTIAQEEVTSLDEWNIELSALASLFSIIETNFQRRLLAA